MDCCFVIVRKSYHLTKINIKVAGNDQVRIAHQTEGAQAIYMRIYIQMSSTQEGSVKGLSDGVR